MVIEEIVWHFKQTDALVAFGVFWMGCMAVPATLACAVPLLIMWLRSVKRKIDSIKAKHSC